MIIQYLLLTNVFSSVSTLDINYVYEEIMIFMHISNICTDRDHAV